MARVLDPDVQTMYFLSPYPGLLRRQTIGHWEGVSRDAWADPDIQRAITYEVKHKVVRYCSDNRLTMAGPIDLTVHEDVMTNMLAVLAEAQAFGIVPEPKKRRRWWRRRRG